MRSRHDRRPTNGQTQANYRTIRISSRSGSNAPRDGFDIVQSWLNATPGPSGLAGSEEHDPQTNDRLRETNWRPNNLPVDPISPIRHRNDPQRTRQLPREPAYTTSPEPYLDDLDTASQLEPVVETGSNKENKKRPRSLSRQKLSDDISEKSSFGRRPRRKTHLDRYTSKNKGTGRSSVKAKKKSRKKSRSKKHLLRSSQDVVTNFVSGAIPNTRVTASQRTTTYREDAQNF